MQRFPSDDKALSLPETAFELCQYLGFSEIKQVQWAWYELSGAVLSRYLFDEEQRYAALLKWFYQDLGFCEKAEYFSREAADLGRCLQSRQGNSTTLATALMLLGRELDLKTELILLPGTTVMSCQLAGEIHYVDPLTGQSLNREQLHALVRGELGNWAPMKDNYLKPASAKQVLTRMLHELKAGCIIERKFESAMECCSLLLDWYPDDLNLHRERAFIAQQLGAIQVATADLQYFIDNNPHDPIVELVKMQLQELGEETQVFH
ncbi:tetratricopeptide repeat protein [Shewanella sp. A32]|uniref:transglutaminase family protein n=1 Tax=Shewanella sp. A32 TaxID=3031327 RepID=UPI0023B9FE04|nr:tetratricopeptide repeat protein [Shewanella sp. A32]MDF0533836.1 tetratricopeptide repeat protein [Shewanella sp. A32]